MGCLSSWIFLISIVSGLGGSKVTWAASARTTRGGIELRHPTKNKVLAKIPNGKKVVIDSSRPGDSQWIYVVYQGMRGRIPRSAARGAPAAPAEAAPESRGGLLQRLFGGGNRQRSNLHSDDFDGGGSDSVRGSCGSVTVDCRAMKIHFSGARLSDSDALIDCGRGTTTKNGYGTIGGRHSGRLVKDGVQINNIPGMGASGGGRVFHVAWWKKNGLATGANDSKGCIHVSPRALQLLKTCKGARLEIKGARGRGESRPRGWDGSGGTNASD